MPFRAAIAPVAAADRPDASKKAQDKKKDAKKKDEKKKGGKAPAQAGWDQSKNKKQ